MDFDLTRFCVEQNRRDSMTGESAWDRALREIRAGRKRGHWIWYVFPQMRGLGYSELSVRFGISGLEEARAYLAHPELGPRLKEITAALLALPERNALMVVDFPDNLKLRSSMTLFALADPEEPLFKGVLSEFFGGRQDEKTLQLLGMEVQG